MDVRDRCSRPRAGAFTVVLVLGLLTACASDTTTAPDEKLPPNGSAAPQPDLDVRASAAAHYADGYAWACNPTTASYTAGSSCGYAFSRSGKTITLTRQSKGTYTVRFAGLSALLGTKSTVHVTGYTYDNHYCKPANQKLLSDVVHIRCFDAASGSPEDSYYTVYITKNHGDLAFAYGSLPTSTNYAPPASASHNPAGTIRIVRNGVGSYTVVFNNLGSRNTSNGGDVQINAIGTGAQHCNSGGWGGNPNLSINVQCYSRGGAPKDVKFNVFFATPSANLAYLWIARFTSSSTDAGGFFSSNPGGGPITITRSGTGEYSVTFSGFSPLADGGDVQVTEYGGGNAVCKVGSWGGSDVNVRCFNPQTNAPVDAGFNLMYFS